MSATPSSTAASLAAAGKTRSGFWFEPANFLLNLSASRRLWAIIALVSAPLWLYAIVTASVTLATEDTSLGSILRFTAGRVLLFPILFGTYLLAMKAAGASLRSSRFWLLQILIAAVFLTVMYPLLLLLNSWAFDVPVPVEKNFVIELLRGNYQNALAPFRLWKLWVATSLELSEIYILGLALMLALDSFLRYRAEQTAAAELHAKWLEAQLAALREQIGPHFLFNALNTILGLIAEAPEMAEKMTIELGAMLRHNLDLRNQEFTTVGDEIDFVERYLSVMKMRFAARLQVSIEIDPRIARYRMPSFLLLPLVENAIKHGVGRIPGVNSIEVRGELVGSRLSFKVINSAAGAAEGAAEAAHREIGLENTRTRIATLYGEHGEVSSGFEQAGRWVSTVLIPARTQ